MTKEKTIPGGQLNFETIYIQERVVIMKYFQTLITVTLYDNYAFYTGVYAISPFHEGITREKTGPTEC